MAESSKTNGGAKNAAKRDIQKEGLMNKTFPTIYLVTKY
jgi:hypothetical protein